MAFITHIRTPKRNKMFGKSHKSLKYSSQNANAWRVCMHRQATTRTSNNIDENVSQLTRAEGLKCDYKSILI